MKKKNHLHLVMLLCYINAMCVNVHGSMFEERSAEVIKHFANVPYTTRGTPKYTFLTLDGTTLETQFRTSDKINGHRVTYVRKSWSLLHNPWIHQD